jgi:4-hydroxybenzoate polyprenyltransferase
MPAFPLEGWASRMGVYLREMFPLPQRALLSLLLAAGFGTPLLRLHGRTRPGIGELWLPAFAVFTLMLTLRLMDELKDQDVDRRLFPERPLPSGRVRERDIRSALVVSTVLFLGAHLAAGRAVWSALGVLAYAGLMFRWFFVPRLLRPSLPLTLATHTPVIPLLLGHVAVVLAVARGLRLAELRAAPTLALVCACWAGVLAWELARKVRAPQDEDEYVTYSRLLGARHAVSLAATVQVAGCFVLLALLAACGSPWVASLAVAGGLAAALVAHARFLRRPCAETARLGPAAERYVLGLALGGLLA